MILERALGLPGHVVPYPKDEFIAKALGLLPPELRYAVNCSSLGD